MIIHFVSKFFSDSKSKAKNLFSSDGGTKKTFFLSFPKQNFQSFFVEHEIQLKILNVSDKGSSFYTRIKFFEYLKIFQQLGSSKKVFFYFILLYFIFMCLKFSLLSLCCENLMLMVFLIEFIKREFDCELFCWFVLC